MVTMAVGTDFAKCITRFMSVYLPHERNASPNTIASYRDTFVQFIDFMKSVKGKTLAKLTLSDLTRDNVLDFLQWVVDIRNCSNATRNYRLASIHAFVYYLQYSDIGRMEEWQKILSIKAAKTAVKALNYLTPDGVKLLLEQPDQSTPIGRKHLTLLSLMYDTGARVQEMADLTVESLRIASKPYTIRIVGKGRKARIVPLVDEQTEILRSYVTECGLDAPKYAQHPLFTNRSGGKLGSIVK